jgi:NADH-quinone oxidoreductase subunit M
MLPLLGMLGIAFVAKDDVKTIRIVACTSCGLAFLVSVWLYLIFDPNAAEPFQFKTVVPWFPQLHISYIVAVDGLNMPMLLLSGILAISAALVSCNVQKRVKEYYLLALASIAGVFGVFESMDLFFLVLFYELASIPMYFLVGLWGSQKKGKGRVVSLQYAATKLILYLQLGGALVLLSAIAFYYASPLHTFDFTEMYRTFQTQQIPVATQHWLFPLVFVAFGIEAGLVPFHTWLPDGHSSAPTALSMLLAGVLLKMGGYGIVRLGFQLLPHGAMDWMPLFGVIGVVNILYGALNALRQSDLKYMIAYSSVSHMGMVFLGLATFNAMGVGGAIFQMFSHGVITALLFALAGYIYEKTHTRDLDEMGGLVQRMPFLGVAFIIAAFGSAGLPGMTGFVAEFLVFFGTWKYNWVLAAAASLTLVYTATYLLRAVQKMFYGDLKPDMSHVSDAPVLERVPVTLLAGVTLLCGFWPRLILDVMNPAIDTMLKLYGK